MENKEKIKKIRATAKAVGGTVRDDYSGRFMFGKNCYGIDCDNAVTCIEQAAKRGLTGARYDNMGLGYIVYWPNIQGKASND